MVWRERGGERMLADGLPRIAAGETTPYALADEIARAAEIEYPSDREGETR
jgi:hypothetical protein